MTARHDYAADQAVLTCLRALDHRALRIEEICAQTGLSNWTVRIALQNLEAAGAVSKRKASYRGHPWLYEFRQEPMDRKHGKFSAAGLMEVWG